ncbi:MAG: glycosylhydrolase-like jelly roll fold domain-containing protein [Armatimonadota bacterium]
MFTSTEFRNPPAAYRPMPFWFWNGKLEIPRLEQQIADMHQKGIGGFFIHARFGLDTAYLSREWLDCVKASVKMAEKLGMEVWLYDEANFPSGLSDLKVTAKPEFRAKFVDLTETSVAGPGIVDLAVSPGEVLCAKAVLCEQGRLTNYSVDLMESINGDLLNWNAPSGEWQVMVFVLQVLDAPNGKVFGVDYMNQDATQLFLETTHEVYARELDKYFGKTIKGFFVDEPTLLPWHHDISWYGLRPHTRVVAWSVRLAEQLEDKGLPASELLPHLFYTIDDTTPEKRQAFYEHASRLYVESFFKPYREWCDKHNLLLTGHLLLEEGLYCNTIFQADPVPALACMHIPGTDHLGVSAEGPYGGWNHVPQMRTNIQGEKLVSSVSHLIANSRTLSETFGCAGWGLTLEDMKRITDWQYSIGINFLCPHALFYSVEGFRKADAPPSHNHNASWPYYRFFADYAGRLSYMLSDGKHIAQVAVLYPIREFQGVYEIGRENEADRGISDAFDSVCTVLPQISFDYDIIHPSLLDTANMDGGRLRIGNEEFDVLLLPTDVQNDRVASRVREFESKGGCVIRMPKLANWDLEALGKWLKDTLSMQISPDVIVVSADEVLSPIRCLHRRKDELDIYFLTNTSNESQGFSVSLRGEMNLTRLDLETGNVFPAAVVHEDGRTNLDCVLPPYGSTMFLSSQDEPSDISVAESASVHTIDLGDEWQFSLEGPNCLLLDKWQFELRTCNNTHRYTYRTSFEAEEVPGNLLLLLDDIEYRSAFMGGMNITIQVNEQKWINPHFGTYIDYGLKTLDITSAVHTGANRITLTIFHDAWTGEPKLITSTPKLLGDFEVVSISPGRIRRPAGKALIGSWTDQGYPFFSGTGSYSTFFSLPTSVEYDSVRLLIEEVGDMFEVFVNDKPAGVRPWRPWALDIDSLVHSGNNKLTIKVTNTMQNFLEGTPRPSGLLGRVSLEIGKVSKNADSTI